MDIWVEEIIMSKVAIKKLDKNYKEAISGVFEAFGGIKNFFPTDNDGKLFIKINAVHLTPYCYTEPEFLAALLDLYIEAGLEPDRIHVIENCTSGLITRITMYFTGLTKVIKERGCNCVFMDEQPFKKVKIGKEQYEVDFAEIVVDEIINKDKRKKNILIHVPKFKAHWATKITIGIKLSLGYLFDSSKAIRHDWYHEERLVDIFEKVRPDFCIVDAKHAMARGPCASEKYLRDPDDPYIYDYNIVFGGSDTVAVDAISAKLMGYESLEVGTTRIAHERGLGIGDEAQIEIIYEGDVDGLIQSVPYDFRSRSLPEKCLPPNYVELIGINKYGKNVLAHCRCGCVGLSLVSLELIWQDSGDLAKRNGLTAIFGKGFEEEQLENLVEPILLLGPCACELLDDLKEKYNDIRTIDECGNLNRFYDVFLQALEIEPLSTVNFNENELIFNLLLAQLNSVDAFTPLSLETKDIISLLNSGIDDLPVELFKDEEFETALQQMLSHEKTGVRAETQKFLGKIIKNKNLEQFSIHFKNGLIDKKNKVVKSSLKTIKSLAKNKPDIVKTLKPQLTELTKHDNNEIQKMATEILQQ
ncbi:MAG: DUF362 domain-containing protein [Candidatus Helarchaeota archaeon]